MRVWREIPGYTKLEHITQKFKKKKKWRTHRKEAEEEIGGGSFSKTPQGHRKKARKSVKTEHLNNREKKVERWKAGGREGEVNF